MITGLGTFSTKYYQNAQQILFELHKNVHKYVHSCIYKTFLVKHYRFKSVIVTLLSIILDCQSCEASLENVYLPNIY